jgi:hypothetical protein
MSILIEYSRHIRVQLTGFVIWTVEDVPVIQRRQDFTLLLGPKLDINADKLSAFCISAVM